MTDYHLRLRTGRSGFHCTHSQRATRFDKLNDALSATFHARRTGMTLSAESETKGGTDLATKRVS